MSRSSLRVALATALLMIPAALAVAPASAAPAEDPPVLGPPPIERYPDLAVAAPGMRFSGREVRPMARSHAYLSDAGSVATFRIELCNRNGGLGRITLQGTPSGARFKVRYTTLGGSDLTRAFVAGTYKLRVGMGECVRYRAVVRRTAAASDGDVRTFVVTARPARVSALLDRIGAVTHAAGPLEPHGPCVPAGPGEPWVCP